MGTLGPVFRAYDGARERLVAVKLFSLDLPPERTHQLVGAFERLIAAQLAHPAIAAPIAAGIHNVSAYLVQDFVAAESLDFAIREYGPAPPAAALRVAAQLAGALDFAAAVNITHGALHPRDVLLSAEETRLTGIGIARALQQVGATAPVRRPYTPPERMAGAEWNRRADVFSLAALVHELLFGRRLTGVGAEAVESLTDIAGADADALRSAFSRALAVNPDERFASALEFAQALKNAFPDDVLAAAPAVAPTARVVPQGAPPPVANDRAAARVTPPPVANDRGPARVTPPSPPSQRASTPATPAPAVPAERPAARVVPAAELPLVVRPAAAEPVPPLADVPLAHARAQEERYRDVEVAPALETGSSSARDADPPMLSPSPVDPRSQRDEPLVAANPVAKAPARFERPPSSIGPLALALLVGLLIGFGGGYGVGRGTRAVPSSSAAAVAPGDARRPAPPTRDYTDNPVGDSSRAVAPPPAVAGAAGAATARPEASPKTEAGSAQDEEEGRLLVRSTPAGARVFVDGKDAGPSPAVVRDLARGAHRVRVTHDAYQTEERQIAITADRPSQSLTIALERPAPAPTATRGARTAPPTPSTPSTLGRFTGTLTVVSRPPGATLYVDGRIVGTTPLSVPDVTAGSHAIRLEHDGYRRWTSSVRVVASEQNRVTASLER